MTEYLDKFNDANETLQYTAAHLHRLADAFSSTGNAQMCNVLNSLGNDIIYETEYMQEAFNEQLNTWIKSTNESTGLLLQAALSGAKLKEAIND